MGWLWGSSTRTDSDPLKGLDPSLREFLAKESPVKYQPVAPPPQQQPSKPSVSDSPEVQSSSEEGGRKVPRQSQYQDGRYAHLWKTYRPLQEIEAEIKTDQEKLLDVLQGYKNRKGMIGRAALENCALEQIDVQDCWENGGMGQRLMMCRTQEKSFNRCYEMQSRFLKALGYLSTYGRASEVDEQIQMHADTLYHRMLAQEEAIEEARSAGRPIPRFPSILSPDQRPQAPKESAEPTETKDTKDPGVDDLPQLLPTTVKLMRPEAAQQLRERIKDMDPLSREYEEKSAVAEVEDARETAQSYNKIMHHLTEARKKRRAEGNATVGDTISGWLGW